MTGPRNEQEHEELRRERRALTIGAVQALVLTCAAFAIPATGLLTGLAALAGIALLGVLQIAVHFRWFLHLDLRRSHRHDLQLVLFTVLIVTLMVGGSIWILFDLHDRMM